MNAISVHSSAASPCLTVWTSIRLRSKPPLDRPWLAALRVVPASAAWRKSTYIDYCIFWPTGLELSHVWQRTRARNWKRDERDPYFVIADSCRQTCPIEH